MPFVKLDRGLLTSTLWSMRPEMEVFVTALLLAEPREFMEPTPTLAVGSLQETGFILPPGWYGFVPAAGPGIVGLAHVERDAGMLALERLASPEPESRSKGYDGRRMVRVDGGFVVLNFMKYRDYDHSAADRMRRLRERRKGVNVTANGDGVTANGDAMSTKTDPVTRNVTHSRVQKTESREQRAESETGDGQHEAAPTAIPDFFSAVKASGAYPGIDVDREFAKMKLWCSTHNKQPTKRRLLAWLNRVELPINGSLPVFGDPYRPA